MKTCYKHKDSEAIGHEDTSYLKGSSLSQRKQERLLGTGRKKRKERDGKLIISYEKQRARRWGTACSQLTLVFSEMSKTSQQRQKPLMALYMLEMALGTGGTNKNYTKSLLQGFPRRAEEYTSFPGKCMQKSKSCEQHTLHSYRKGAA